MNAFCETPLQERSAPAFPDQMLNYSNRREHCLVTSTQLLGMVLSSRGKKRDGEKFLERVLDTVGVFDEMSDYRGFLTQNEEATTEPSVQ